jgi:signal transduction histidine kinase
MSTTSLRRRLIVGATLWTLGLFSFFGVILTYLVRAHPGPMAALHWPSTHFGFAILLTAVLLAAGLLQVRRGVSPISQLRQKLAGIHAGTTTRVDGDYPDEVAPLVTDLNALLAQHELAVARAHTKAEDMAHGLKTPLAVLQKEAAAVDAAGHHDLAESLRQQISRMRRQVDYHLAHSRAAASSGGAHTRAAVTDSVDGLIRAVQRIYAERQLDIQSLVPSALSVRVEPQDLDEMIGNLLDNACKWARHHVTVSAEPGDHVMVFVDDDGPGVPEGQREDVLRRGVRADEAAPGSGFGLAIVRDLAELYGGTIELTASPLGGTRAVLTLPAAGEPLSSIP